MTAHRVFGKRPFLRLAILLLAVGLMGFECVDGTFFEIILATFVPPTLKGKELTAQVYKSAIMTTVHSATATVRGSLSQAPTGVAGLAALPSKLQLVLRHKSTGGKALDTITMNVTVSSNGLIPIQNYPFTGMVVKPNETLSVSIVPVDADLPFSKLSLRVRLKTP